MKANAIANYLGRAWTTLVGLLSLPLFLLLLGSEAYGLIGAFAVVQAWTMLLDFGLTPTLNLEMSRARAGSKSWQSTANLLRSIELLSIAIAAIALVTVALMSGMLTRTWLQPQSLARSDVQYAVVCMGALAAIRWIEQVYRGAIQGIEDQVWLNGALVTVETLRWGGALLVIRFIEPNVLLFFGWNLMVAIGSASILRRRVKMVLRAQGAGPARPDLAELKAVRGFAGGMFLSALLTFLLTQADKIVVGSMASLSDFGLYSLAATAAAGLLQLVQPLTTAILPRFTALAAARRQIDLSDAFRAASEWMAVAVAPVGLLVLALPEHALMAWTGQPVVARAAAPTLSLLMLASLFNALANIPYMLQLAHGWTSLTNKLNALLILAMLPAMMWAAEDMGAAGAAGVLAALNLASMLILSWLVLSRLLPAERLRWAMVTVAMPLLLGGGVALALRLLLPPIGGRAAAFLQLGFGFFAITLTMLLIMPHPRRALLVRVRQRVRAFGL
ncbi:oligosaccharide flippase family protein [Sphingomonas changnyeongensis]|uniref:Oligosaccharide flippase family protein n=1 Tax=Sphingomonas changnyeongensis TaxID=2698679 RepID=A0A7Z2NVB8_9SPHN|nr:oligosaccharide flippase family protein [Sphingomonas changnyeongensis]QHL90227.1 oligosaccharide flippase family protein [Sphingomonas changnyeongensis]